MILLPRETRFLAPDERPNVWAGEVLIVESVESIAAYHVGGGIGLDLEEDKLGTPTVAPQHYPMGGEATTTGALTLNLNFVLAIIGGRRG